MCVCWVTALMHMLFTPRLWKQIGQTLPPLTPEWYFPALCGEGEAEVRSWGSPVLNNYGFLFIQLWSFSNFFSSFHHWTQKLSTRQVQLPFPYMQPDICESHCSPISSDHRAGSLSELTSAEHIVAISLAWCVISVLSCCWGCCPVQRGDTCMREGIVVTCHHASVTVPGVSVAPSGPLSLRLAANSWLPEPVPC